MSAQWNVGPRHTQSAFIKRPTTSARCLYCALVRTTWQCCELSQPIIEITQPAQSQHAPARFAQPPKKGGQRLVAPTAGKANAFIDTTAPLPIAHKPTAISISACSLPIPMALTASSTVKTWPSEGPSPASSPSRAPSGSMALAPAGKDAASSVPSSGARSPSAARPGSRGSSTRFSSLGGGILSQEGTTRRIQKRGVVWDGRLNLAWELQESQSPSFKLARKERQYSRNGVGVAFWVVAFARLPALSGRIGGCARRERRGWQRRKTLSTGCGTLIKKWRIVGQEFRFPMVQSRIWTAIQRASSCRSCTPPLANARLWAGGGELSGRWKRWRAIRYLCRIAYLSACVWPMLFWARCVPSVSPRAKCEGCLECLTHRGHSPWSHLSHLAKTRRQEIRVETCRLQRCLCEKRSEWNTEDLGALLGLRQLLSLFWGSSVRSLLAEIGAAPLIYANPWKRGIFQAGLRCGRETVLLCACIRCTSFLVLPSSSLKLWGFPYAVLQ